MNTNQESQESQEEVIEIVEELCQNCAGSGEGITIDVVCRVCEGDGVEPPSKADRW